jgi:hypothetical protein
LLTGEEKKPEGVGLGGLLGAGAMLPGPAGDVLEPLADAYMFASKPESRTWGNVGMAALGALPLVPSFGVLKRIDEDLWRGGKAESDGQFFSRDADYAKGFDKGHFGKYRLTVDKAMDFSQPLSPEEVETIAAALRRNDEKNAADMIYESAVEDGGVLPGHLYMWLERLAKNSPESYLKEAGIKAIDTGRDVRLLDPNLARLGNN